MSGIHHMLLASAPSAATVNISFVLVGGGGAGADRTSPGRPSGGGAGGVVSVVDLPVNLSTAYTFARGSGGEIVGGASGATGGDGGDSTFAGYTAKGGGGGANNATVLNDSDGGSGGGHGFDATYVGVSTQNTYSGDSYATGYGNDGSLGTGTSPFRGGGGGGAGEDGGVDALGYGGDGFTNALLTSAQTGENVGGNYYVSGGGGGGMYASSGRLLGGDGGGADGANQSSGATSALANSGGGGGGGNRTTSGSTRLPSNGATGAMALKIPDSYSVTGTASYTLVATTGGFKYYRVTDGGDITVS